MTLPKTGGTEWTASQASPWAAVNDSLRRVDALSNRAIVVDRDLTAPPGTCADGANYLVAASATGLWSGQDGKLATAQGTNASNGWKFQTVAVEGFRIYLQDENIELQHDGSAWGSPAQSGSYYDFGFAFEATPDADAIVGRIRIGRTVTVPANMTGAYGGPPDTNPTATFDIDVRDDGVSVGTVSIATGGTVTFTTTSGTAKTITAGSEILFVAPTTPDATVAGFSAVIAATVN